MVPWLKVCTALAKGLKSAPSSHTGRLTTVYNSSFGVSVTSGLYKYLHPCAHTYMQTRHDSYTEVTDRSLTPATSLNLRLHKVLTLGSAFLLPKLRCACKSPGILLNF